MKHALLVVAMLAFGIQGALAQNTDKTERRPEAKAEKMTEMMTEKLELTDDQKTAVYEANLKLVSSERDQRQALLDQHQADMRKILSEEQYEQWETARKERMEKHRAEHKGHRKDKD